MNTLNNLSYELQINYINNDGINVVAYKKIYKNGLEVKSIQVGDVCITEETINGRVLSGKYDDKKTLCGYKYNYEKDNEEYLENINENIPLSSAVSLINKTKMEPAFLSAKMAFVAISRNDNRVFAIKNGKINISKTATANNDQDQHCCYQESVVWEKEDSYEACTEKAKACCCQIENICVTDSSQDFEDTKSSLKILSTIVDNNPTSYQELNEIKSAEQMATALEL